nr:MAG: hypothetical protein EDM05_12850 [Leptolyngbya sp. IPPAS B-1204]
MLVITGMTLAVDGTRNQFILTGSFELVEPVKWASGTFSMSFGLRWNRDTSRVEIAAGPPPRVVPELEAWVKIVFAVLGGTAFAASLGIVAGPIGVVIGGVVGAAVGVVAANIVQEITRTIANMSITGTARGLVGTPLFPLPLLSPSELMTQNVLLDDLVIVSRLEVAYVNLRGELRITDRQYLSTSAPPLNRVRLTWKGTFEAVPVHLTPPFRFLWTVNGVRLYYEGEIPVTQGTLRYRVDGSRCTLTTTHGNMLNEMLCVEVTDARGIWMLACKALRAEGERTEVQEINPRDEALISRLFRLPPHLIPGPAPDVFFNPKIAAQIQADYVSAVARGMSVDPGSL